MQSKDSGAATAHMTSSASSSLPSTKELPSTESSSNSENLNFGNMENPEELDVFVKELMDNMQTRFSRLSDTILGRIDDMGSKIDALEKSISELMDQAGVDPTETPAVTEVVDKKHSDTLEETEC